MNWCCLCVTGEPRVSSLFPQKMMLEKSDLSLLMGLLGKSMLMLLGECRGWVAQHGLHAHAPCCS